MSKQIILIRQII